MGQGCATPGCIRPQPALDPATGLPSELPHEQFSGPEKTRRRNCADLDSRSHLVEFREQIAAIRSETLTVRAVASRAAFGLKFSYA